MPRMLPEPSQRPMLPMYASNNVMGHAFPQGQRQDDGSGMGRAHHFGGTWEQAAQSGLTWDEAVLQRRREQQQHQQQQAPTEWGYRGQR